MITLTVLTAGFLIAPASAEDYATDPFPIATSQDLLAFREYVEGHSDETVNAVLDADVTYENWDGLIGGTGNKPYNGTFDGNGKTIKLVNENLGDSKDFGLFYEIPDGSVVKDFTLEVRAKTATDINTAGLICPVARFNRLGGTIRDITVNCEVITVGSAYGVAVTNFGRIEGVTVNGWIESEGVSDGDVAGIASNSIAGSVISRCVNNATIKGNRGAAGLLGTLNGRLEYSANHGDVTTTRPNYNTYKGGLVGLINNANPRQADIYNCYNAGRVYVDSSTEALSVGGLVGGFTANQNLAFQAGYGIKNSFNYGAVEVGNGKSAAIIGAGNGSSNRVTVAEVNREEFESVYYLANCAYDIFGPSSAANTWPDVGTKFISKESADFATTLVSLLNAGDGGMEQGRPLWIQGSHGFPILEVLGDKPDFPTARPVFVEGGGSVEPPPPTREGEWVEIRTEADLRSFADAVAEGGNYLSARLMNDLSLEGWESIDLDALLVSGKAPKVFNGTFDGQGHKITLTNHTSDIISLTGLFYWIGEEGAVKNIELDVHISGVGSSGGGAVAMRSFGRMERVTVRGEIEAPSADYGSIGGLVSEAYHENASFTECANYADITGGYTLAGIAAAFTGKMESCANYGTITGLLEQPSIGGLVGGYRGLSASDYRNCYNAGEIHAPTSTDSLTVGALFGQGGLPALYPEGYPGYFRSSAINCFNYGRAVLKDGALGAVMDGHISSSPVGYDKFENVFYLDTSGGMIAFAGIVKGEDDEWGTPHVKSKVTSMDQGQFSDGTLLGKLIDYRANDGTYPGREGGAVTGRALWVQEKGGDYPELWIFRKDLPKPEAPSSGGGTGPGNGGDTGNGGGGTSPGTGGGTDTGSADTGGSTASTAVTVEVPQTSVSKVENSSGAETYEISVPESALEAAISQAAEAAAETGTPATVEIPVAESYTPGADAVIVNIPIGGAEAAAAESAVENVRIVTAIGEVTLDKEALKSLIAEAGDADTVGVAIERKGASDADLTEAQKTALGDGKVREVYDVSAVIDEGKLRDFETTGKLTIGLPHALRQGETAGGVWAVYVAENGSAERMTDGRKYESGKAYFKTTHLSVYAVIYDAGTEADTETGTDFGGSSGGGGCDAGFGLFALAGLGVLLLRKHGK
jgi:hypothetical protein